MQAFLERLLGADADVEALASNQHQRPTTLLPHTTVVTLVFY